jgi:LysR family glycine cleavage system transcriptional activator
MASRLPPLNALHAFEVAARHLSFTRAADELNVTQGAVSHRIRALEERLGRPLFRRDGRAMALTEAGEDYLPYPARKFP